MQTTTELNISREEILEKRDEQIQDQGLVIIQDDENPICEGCGNRKYKCDCNE